MNTLPILTIQHKKEEKILRKRTAEFDFSAFSRSKLMELIKTMRESMIKANGIGLAANQVGLDMQFFVAQISPHDRHGNARSSKENYKFYAIFNPKIIKTSKEKILLEEGCLSVPGGYYGEVERHEKIVLTGFDKNGKKIKIKAWGLLARVFQHETDHLNGTLFIDKAKNIKRVEINGNKDNK